MSNWASTQIAGMSPLPPPPLLLLLLLPAGSGSAGSAATTLCPPSGRQVRAARQALLLPAASIVSRILAWFSAPFSCCRGPAAEPLLVSGADASQAHAGRQGRREQG